MLSLYLDERSNFISPELGSSVRSAGKAGKQRPTRNVALCPPGQRRYHGHAICREVQNCKDKAVKVAPVAAR
jgi:hypothetical protein